MRVDKWQNFNFLWTIPLIIAYYLTKAYYSSLQKVCPFLPPHLVLGFSVTVFHCFSHACFCHSILSLLNTLSSVLFQRLSLVFITQTKNMQQNKFIMTDFSSSLFSNDLFLFRPMIKMSHWSGSVLFHIDLYS